MVKRLSFLAGLGVGYVLGARAGRERYEQIADKARTVWRDPRVRKTAGQAQQVVKEKASEAGSTVSEKVSDKVGSSHVGSNDNGATTTRAGTGLRSSTGG